MSRKFRIVTVSVLMAFVVSGIGSQTRVSFSQETPTLEFLGQILDNANDVAVEGEFVYVTNGALKVIDFSDPSSPNEVGSYYIQNCGFLSLDVSGSYAYVGQNGWICYVEGVRVSDSLHVVDVSNSSNPNEVGWLNMTGIGVAWEITKSETYAYVAHAEGGLLIIDITDPTDPKGIGSFNPAGISIYDIKVIDNKAYLAAGSGLWIVDVSDPANPFELGHYSSVGAGVDVQGNYAYLAAGNDGVRIIDITNPTNPYEVGYYSWRQVPGYNGSVSDVEVVNNYAFLADGPEGVRVVDVSDPEEPVEVSYYNTGGRASRLAVSGDLVFVADVDVGLVILRFTGTEPPPETAVIAGMVLDSIGPPVRFATVDLISNGSVLDSTTTDGSGMYEFPDQLTSLEPGTYTIRVNLRHDNPATGTAILRVQHGDSPVPVTAETSSFTLSVGETRVFDITFGTTPLTTDSSIPVDRLDDLATIYFHSVEALVYGRDVLGITHNLQLPIDVFAFRGSDVHYECHLCTEVERGADVFIAPAYSHVYHSNRPMNREWHEMFHELMDDTIGIPQRSPEDSNHGGFANSSTLDSWVEGWADFWPTQLGEYVEMPNPNRYRLWGGEINLEDNIRASDQEHPEEFAVASLLFDLVDQVDAREDDFTDLSVSELWAVIRDAPLQNMKDVYDELVGNQIENGDADSDNLTDLDEIFIAHGFFVDTNGNNEFDLWEEIGRAADVARPDRRNAPPIPGANLLINVIDEQGQPVGEGTIEVVVEYQDFPDRNYTYSVDLASVQGGLLPVYPPPSHIPATVSLRVVTPSGETSDTLLSWNATYWDIVQTSDRDYVATHDFDLGKAGTTTVLVTIDIKPGSNPNCFNNDGHGVIPVAIISSVGFDATQVDPTTISLDGQEIRIVGKGNTQAHIEDVNGDGLDDLIVQIEDADGTYQEGDAVATLTGETYDGLKIQGVDSIRIVP